MGVSVAFLTKAWHKTDISQSKSKYLTSKPRSCNANTVFKKKKNELRDRSVNFIHSAHRRGVWVEGLSDRDTIHREETSLTASPCQLVNYLNESALACTHVMVARAANSCDCRMIKQFIMMQPTISRGRLTIREL